MKVIVADFYRINREHLMYNLSMLDILSEFPHVSNIEFHAHPGQIDFIKQELRFSTVNKITFVPAHVHELVGGRQWLKKIGYELRNVIWILNRSPVNSLVFFCSLSPISSFFFKLLKIFYRKQKVLVTLHGDIDFIQQNKTRFRNWLGKFFIWSFKIKDKNTKYIILSNQIKDNLIETGYLRTDEMYAINHPYIFDAQPQPVKLKSKTIRIGHIGVASQEKNTQFIFKLAEQFKDEIMERLISFCIIGMATNVDGFKNNWVEYAKSEELLSKQSFNEQISKLDFVVFFYGDENYRFCSSGAILDAINHEIPILSLNNQGFQYMFNEADGPIGYLCNNVEEMKRLITERLLVGYDQVEYDQMRYNLRGFKNKYTIAYVKEQLLKQVNGFVYGK